MRLSFSVSLSPVCGARDDGDAHGTTGLHEAIVQTIDVVGRDRVVGLGPMSI